MAESLNVYSGSDSIRNFYDPERQPPLPLVEIPACLNPHRARGVRIYAKMMTLHPASNVKVLPGGVAHVFIFWCLTKCMPKVVMNILEKEIKPGKTKTIVESSSGSTVISLAMVARAFYAIDDVQAYLSNKTDQAKLRLMQFFGLNITLFGGPAQPTPVDERGGTRAAARKASEDDTICSPSQYENEQNWQSHFRWTGPQIYRQLPHINLIAAAMGTTGTMTGLGRYFQRVKPSVFRLAVCTQASDRVPGPRELLLMNQVPFPYQTAIDGVEEVGSTDAYSLSLELTRQGILCGPSSGLTLKGLLQYLERRIREQSLSHLAAPNGDINCVFLCCDLPYQYVNEYFKKLPPDKFHPIRNETLRHVDLYRYDESWERQAQDAMLDFYTVPADICSASERSFEKLLKNLIIKPDCEVLDFRRLADFDTFHLPKSISVPLETLREGSVRGSPFADPGGDCSMLVELWSELDRLFSSEANGREHGSNGESVLKLLHGKRVLTLCYDGDCARVANSVLRAKGIHSESVRGGFAALSRVCLPRIELTL